MSSQNYVRVFLRDYAVQLRVGVTPSERPEPQTIIINLECEAVAAHRFNNPHEESFEHAIDYSKAYHFIATELAAMPHIPLLESVAEIIADFCLRDPHIGKVRVRLEKPHILSGCATAGVEIQRVRNST